MTPTMRFPAQPLELLLAPHLDWIERIRLCYGTERPRFEQEVLRVIQRFAAYVHLLPATPQEEFCTCGGLLHLSLQTAFYSLQGSDTQIFSGQASVVARRELEPRWRLATLIAGLCAEAHRPLGQMRVTADTGARWPAALHPLLDWLEQQAATDYEVHWQPDRHPQRGLTLFALPHLVPPDLLQYLADDNREIVPHLLASLSGVPLNTERNVIDTLVRRAQALVIDRERALHAGRHGATPARPHWQPAIQEALRQLLQRHPAWQPNAPKSRVWWGSDGLFLAWPDAASELHQQFATLLIPGLPLRAVALLPLLLNADSVQPQADGNAVWTIRPPDSATPLTALKWAAPEHLQDALPAEFKPLSQPLRIAQEPLPAPATSAAQLPLPLAADTQETPPPPAESTVSLTLSAPLRLNPAVRQALVSALQTLSDTTTSIQACTVAEGLFVPLHTLEQQGVVAATAIRALSEAAMLIPSPPNAVPTHTRDIGGIAHSGVIIDPRFISGLACTTDTASASAPEQAS